MDSNQITFTDIINSLLPISSSSINSPSSSSDKSGVATNAIAELIRKRRNRLENEKKAKGDFENSEDENCSPLKLIKVEESSTPTTNTDTDSLNAFSDSSTLSLLTNLFSPWSQSSSDSSSTSPPSLLSFNPNGENPSFTYTPSSSTSSSINIPQKKSIGDEFAVVCGRLSLLSSQKYVITIGEMARRIFGKEEFGYSLLGGILRRAKTPNATNQLKAELEAVGIQVERGRRRSNKLTLFGGLLEGEAVQLGKDFDSIICKSFPSQIIAQYLTEAAKKEEEKRLEKIEKLKAARSFVNEFLAVLNQDASPILDLYPLPTLPSEIQAPLTNFSILTHGFGILAVKSTMEMYGQTLDAQILALS
uniref:Transcription factor AP-2 C-terminal domain-containing protein n=1 Tax=Panagrolaimus sp. PS1159 TaxID=55785 RepID=A0AC35EV69_9BILA